MKHRSGTDGTRARRASGQPVDAVAYAAASGGGRWNDVIATIMIIRRHIKKIRLRQSMRIYLKNNRASFQP